MVSLPCQVSELWKRFEVLDIVDVVMAAKTRAAKLGDEGVSISSSNDDCGDYERWGSVTHGTKMENSKVKGGEREGLSFGSITVICEPFAVA